MSERYALIIANTEYTDPGLAKLTAPGKDAEDFARVLRNKELCAFDDVRVVLNQPESAVREAIDIFFNQKKPDDLLVLYFSGHGIRDDVGALYLAVPNTNRALLRSTAIKSDFIREAMDNSRSKRQVLILDCCNSGAFSQGAKSATGVSVGTGPAFEGTGYGRIVLTASDATQFAWEGDKFIGETDNSLFTHFLIKGLEGEADRNSDGSITVDELYDYTYEKIVEITPKQTPGKWSYREQGEIVLRNYVPDRAKATRTEELRYKMHEQEAKFRSKQDALIKEKARLENQLNEKQKTTSAPPPAARTQKPTRSTPWFLIVAGLAVFCIALVGIGWIGTRILSSLTATEEPTISEPTPLPASTSEGTAPSGSEPTPIPTLGDLPSQFLNDIQIVSFDSFDDPFNSNWALTSGVIQDGALQIVGDANYNGAWFKHEFEAGSGAIVDFTYTEDTTLELFMDIGVYGADDYKRCGIFIINNVPALNIRSGPTVTGGALSGSLRLTPGDTYTFLIAILPNGEFLMVLWNPDDTANWLEYKNEFGAEWSGIAWTFFMQVGSGSVSADNFRQIEFSGAR